MKFIFMKYFPSYENSKVIIFSINTGTLNLLCELIIFAQQPLIFNILIKLEIHFQIDM